MVEKYLLVAENTQLRAELAEYKSKEPLWMIINHPQPATETTPSTVLSKITIHTPMPRWNTTQWQIQQQNAFKIPPLINQTTYQNQ